MYTQGHRLKNLLGIIGSRTRSARKLAGAEGELSEKLTDLEAEVTSLYNEWAAYLRSMQTAGPVVEVVPVEPLIAEVVGDASAKAAVSIGMSVASGVPDLRGDRLLLREALMNIVSNAADACSDNGGRVNVAVTSVSSGRTPVIQIEVADKGAGISRSDLARIFAPGFTTKDDGSGVGLAIAERVVAAHHGRILVDSKEGEGTTVTVTLPSDLGGFSGLAAFVPKGNTPEVA
jgi:signal transduction histidine kinase